VACVPATRVHGPGKAVQREIPAGLMPAARMQVQPKWIFYKQLQVRVIATLGHQDIRHVRLAGSGHKIFILVDRGSNPLRDANQ
jgi:hypothetical protein